MLPYLFGLTGLTAVLVAAGLVGIALMITGAIVGVLSGAPPMLRALRQIAIGWGAAAATYALGLLFGTTVSDEATAVACRSHRRRPDEPPLFRTVRNSGDFGMCPEQR